MPPSAGREPEAAARLTAPLPPGERPTQAPAVPATPPPAAQAVQPPADPLANLRRLHRLAADQYASIDGYTARLQRREQVRGKDMPPELLLCKFRKQPWSVHFKWIGKEGHDREVVYVKGQYDGKMQIRLAAGDVPFMPAGRLWSIAPENPMAQSRSRHPITEAGLGNLVERFGRLLESSEHGDPRAGSLVYRGSQPLPESQAPAEGVEQVVPPGIDKDLPEGGRRLWLFSADNHLPVLMRTTDAAGHEVEFYYYDSVQFPVALSDDDFNPDKLWPRR